MSDVLKPFYLAAKELYDRYEAKPDDTKIVQIGGTWIRWGDFRRVIALVERPPRVEVRIPFDPDDYPVN